MRRRAAEPRGLTTARTRVVCSLSLVCSVVCGSITESFTAEQREYLERRFTQLTAAMVRPTTTDQVLASGVLLTAQLMAITVSTSVVAFPVRHTVLGTSPARPLPLFPSHSRASKVARRS